MIGTYELSCSERALRSCGRPGSLLVSPVNAADDLPGALRLAPTLRRSGHRGGAARRRRSARRASRSSASGPARPARSRPRSRRRRRAPARPGRRARRVGDAVTEELVTELLAGRVQLVALAGSPGPWADRAPARARAAAAGDAPGGRRAAGVRHARVPRRRGRGRRRRARDLAARARRAARRRARAASPAPTPTSTASRRRSRPMPPTRRATVLTAAARHGRLARCGGDGAARACRHTTGCSGAGRRPRPAASRRGGSPCWWSTTGRSGSNGWSRSRSHCRRPAE